MIHNETHSDLFLFGSAYACVHGTFVRRRPGTTTATSMATVARSALAGFLVDLSAHVFHFYSCDVYSRDEKRRNRLYVA
jgi:hypothetical protein